MNGEVKKEACWEVTSTPQLISSVKAWQKLLIYLSTTSSLTQERIPVDSKTLDLLVGKSEMRAETPHFSTLSWGKNCSSVKKLNNLFLVWELMPHQGSISTDPDLECGNDRKWEGRIGGGYKLKDIFRVRIKAFSVCRKLKFHNCNLNQNSFTTFATVLWTGLFSAQGDTDGAVCGWVTPLLIQGPLEPPARSQSHFEFSESYYNFLATFQDMS
ncbi:hypothetical protein P7K49_018979 [Saguinus oedipus]|uniref:Uncharacterized protein n=1 Tax=Saguinus oedipus TaxID=9490 RepID=A0ABQ9UW11_SAGOE|nr:hypothetical protein P7K49_018979 [Saguinus oedipus]